MTISSSKTNEPKRWTLSWQRDFGTTIEGPGIGREPVEVMPVSEHEAAMDAEWAKRMTTIEGDDLVFEKMGQQIEALRAVVHGHVQVIRGMCTDHLDHREIDRALVRLDDAIDPPEEGS